MLEIGWLQGGLRAQDFIEHHLSQLVGYDALDGKICVMWPQGVPVLTCGT